MSSYMIEVYCRVPVEPEHEKALRDRIAEYGGSVTFRETGCGTAGKGICLTAEFADENRAEVAAVSLRESGAHVEGPSAY